jgi:transposase-like protein
VTTSAIRSSSAILPPYARRSKSLEVLIPILYLKGVSTGDFEEAITCDDDFAQCALGFWQAVEDVWPRTRGQRRWVHKTAMC